MARPSHEPIGLQVNRAAKEIGRAFEAALAAVDGSLPVWLILLSHKTGQAGNQRQLAAAVGITEATLTHHLNAMEADGLLTRRRDPTNRRHHLVELTDQGEAAFARLGAAAVTFDRRLRVGIDDDQLVNLGHLLAQLCANATATP
jgi:MarR family transcriptional regulator for hemolysin